MQKITRRKLIQRAVPATGIGMAFGLGVLRPNLFACDDSSDATKEVKLFDEPFESASDDYIYSSHSDFTHNAGTEKYRLQMRIKRLEECAAEDDTGQCLTVKVEARAAIYKWPDLSTPPTSETPPSGQITTDLDFDAANSGDSEIKLLHGTLSGAVHTDLSSSLGPAYDILIAIATDPDNNTPESSPASFCVVCASAVVEQTGSYDFGLKITATGGEVEFSSGEANVSMVSQVKDFVACWKFSLIDR